MISNDNELNFLATKVTNRKDNALHEENLCHDYVCLALSVEIDIW